MSAVRVPLGEMLVAAQVITREQLEEVLGLQKQDGRRLGTLLVESGVVTETQVTQILSQQLSVPWVSLYHIDFSRQLLDLVPRELAERHCLVPIFVRRVRGQGNTLYVAMDDPANLQAQEEVSGYAGLPVRAMIAPPSDVRSAIRVYYGGVEAEVELAEPPGAPEPPAPRSEPPAAAPASSAEAAPIAPASGQTAVAPASAAPAPALEVSDSEPQQAATRVRRETPPPESGPISAHEVRMPRPIKGGAKRLVTLTLLDGTQINLPARGSAAPKPASEGDPLTARDMVAALRAVAHGADATEVLGENVRWEAMFAALLSLLLKKHLIADWEFVDEYKKF
ncbi:MAG: hypothetical protein KF718_28025 [Polyangiaceae bacterium]|nr:hypothetical protein [Polyangiaceae bacterium]